MRRKDKEITDHAEVEAILQRNMFCRVAFCDGHRPYLLPMNYGYADGCFYFHSASEGRKLDILRKNPAVCIEVEEGIELVSAENPCSWGVRYRTVIAEGNAAFLEEPAAKRQALNCITSACGAGEGFSFPEQALAAVTVFRVPVDSMSGKRSGYPD